MSIEDQDEKEMRLRDQLAIAAMQALMNDMTLYKTWVMGVEVIDDLPQYFQKTEARAEKMAIAAYKIADAMRKARIAAFK